MEVKFYAYISSPLHEWEVSSQLKDTTDFTPGKRALVHIG